MANMDQGGKGLTYINKNRVEIMHQFNINVKDVTYWILIDTQTVSAKSTIFP